VHYITRPDNRHAKAGNLNHAFDQTNGEFIVIFDADHVPESHFITRVIGYFRDEKLGYVQTPHAFYNFDSFQALLSQRRRLYWEEGQLFYEMMQPGRNRWDCPIFAGSAAMFRRKALEEAGYFAVETITEDLHTGMRVNARGWKSLAISERLIAGQAAPDVTTYHSQRLRWAEGNLSIMAYDNPLTMRGLTLAQRLSYFGSIIHWTGGLFKLALYLTPILMLFTAVPPVSRFTWDLVALIVVYLLITFHAVDVASRGYGSFLNSELFNMINFPTQIRGMLRALFRRRFQRFVVTSKRGRQVMGVGRFLWPYVALIVLTAVALVWGWAPLAFHLSDNWVRPLVPRCGPVPPVPWRSWSCMNPLGGEPPLLLPPPGVAACRVPSGGRGRPAVGVTADLSDQGVGLIAYQSWLAPGWPSGSGARGRNHFYRAIQSVRELASRVNGTNGTNSGRRSAAPMRTAGGRRAATAAGSLSGPRRAGRCPQPDLLQYAVPRLVEFDPSTGGRCGERWLPGSGGRGAAGDRAPATAPVILQRTEPPR
jgi:hypothetical protein